MIFGKFWRAIGKVDWKDVERFEASWKERIVLMAQHIVPQDVAVLDIGCGPMWLRGFLPEGVKYIGLDYKPRGDGSLVCDLNADRIPKTEAQVFFISGCLEYVEDVPRFVSDVASMARKCIVSYCGLEEFPDPRYRRKMGWKNGLTVDHLRGLFESAGMERRVVTFMPNKTCVMVFENKANSRNLED